jgi:hypothetical protein
MHTLLLPQGAPSGTIPGSGLTFVLTLEQNSMRPSLYLSQEATADGFIIDEYGNCG